jgi:hypothetical protein
MAYSKAKLKSSGDVVLPFIKATDYSQNISPSKKMFCIEVSLFVFHRLFYGIQPKDVEYAIIQTQKLISHMDLHKA